LVVCGVVLLGLASPAEAANQRIAVIEFVGQAGDSELRDLTDEARLGVLDVTKRKAYTVMTKESIATIARDQGIDLSKCTEAECEVDTGRQIGAHFVVTGKISKIGRTFKFMMKIFDTETAALLTGDTIKAKDMAGLEAELRVFTRTQVAEALGMGSAQVAPAASASAPALATSSTSFGGGGDIKSAMDAKLKEKRCRNTAEQQGKILREQRLTTAVTKLESEATAAYDSLKPTLETCVQLDFEDRAECRDALKAWLEKVSGAQVQLPAGEETVQTDCGPRLAVFSAADRRASIDTKSAEAMLKQLDKRPSVPAAAPSLSQSTELMELAHKVAELERLLKEYGTCPAMVDNGGTEQGQLVLEQSQMVIQMEEVEDAADMMMFYEQLMPQLESITALCPGAGAAVPAKAGSSVLRLADVAVSTKSDFYRQKARQKRGESRAMLEDMLRKDRAKGETKAVMLLRLAENYMEEGEDIFRTEMGGFEKDFDACFNNPRCNTETLKADNTDSIRWRVKAIKIYTLILKSYPQFRRADEASFYLAIALQETGKPDEAAKRLARLVQDYPQSSNTPDAYVLLGEYYFNNNNAYRALQFYKKVALYKSSSKYGFAMYKLAWCYYNVGELGKAIDTMTTAVAVAAKSSKAGAQKLKLAAEKDLKRFIAEQ